MDELGDAVRDDELIRWYGTDANYYFVPPRLCQPIVAGLLKDKMETEPEAVIRRIEDLMLKLNGRGMTAAAMDYCLTVAQYYQKALALGSLTLNTPNEYVMRYQEDYYVLDQLYRQATEQYFKVDPSCGLFPDIQQTKHSLDLHYSKLNNRMNQEWTRCIQETGGMGGVHLSRQQDFYEKRIRPMQKKVAVIVSDALRYEVAQELIGELARSQACRHAESHAGHAAHGDQIRQTGAFTPPGAETLWTRGQSEYVSRRPYTEHHRKTLGTLAKIQGRSHLCSV